MARSFNSVAGDVINVGNVSALNITGQALTLAIWAKPVNFSGGPKLISKWDDGGTTSYLMQLSTGGSLQGNVNGTGGPTAVGPAGTVLTNVWNHCAFTVSPSFLTVFLNGVAVGAPVANVTTLISSAAPIVIGAGANGAGFDNLLTGSLADAAIWNATLTAAEIAALGQGARPWTIRTLSLKGYWPLGGIQSPEPDLSTNANNGTLTGTNPDFGPPFLQFTPRWPQSPSPPPVASIPAAFSILSNVITTTEVVSY